MGHYIHNVPGRLRVRIPCIKSKEANCLEVEEVLTAMPGVIEARANTITGSILVRYRQAAISPARILEELRDLNYLDGSKARSDLGYLKQTAAATGEKVGKALLGWAVGRILEENGLALLSALI